MSSTWLAVVLIVLSVVLIAFLGVAIFLFVKLIRLAKLMRSELMPASGKIAFWAALIYAVFPVDLLPDPIYLDDVGVIAAAVAYITHLARKYGIVEQMRSAAKNRLDRQRIEQ